jgi:hypothetical protein
MVTLSLDSDDMTDPPSLFLGRRETAWESVSQVILTAVVVL